MISKLQAFTEDNFDYLSKKFSASLVFAILSSIAVNFFFQPGNIYSSGATGIAQILTTLSSRIFGMHIPVAITLYAINIPLFILAWKVLGKRFTIFTILTVTLAAAMINFVPETKLTSDPIINAVFGGAINGFGIGYALRNGLSSGGLDIVSMTIRKKTGHTVGSISIMFNVVIASVAGFLFGWQYALYTMITIFIAGRVTDSMFTKQKKMQVMIVTRNPDSVVQCIREEMQRGITIIHSAEGGYTHERQTVLITVITRYEIGHFRRIMAFSDPNAFVSIAENVKIMGNFKDLED